MTGPRHTILKTALLGACVAALSAVALASTPVKNVTLAKNGDFTEVTLPVPARLLCDHFTEPATPERPFRIVLNLCDATHALPQQHFSELPECMVQKIRTSQYATDPEAIVRVVLDLNASATYTVRTEEDRLVIAIADARTPSFSTWNASGAVTMAKVEVTPSSPAPKPGTEAAAAEKSDAPVMAENTKKLSTPSDKPQITPPVAAPSEPVTQKPAQSSTPEPVVATSDETPKSGTTSPVATSPKEVAQPMVQPEAAFIAPKQPLVVAPEFLEGGTAASQDMNEASQPDASAGTATSAFAPVTDPNQPQVWASVPAADNAPILAPAPSTSDTATSQQALIDRLKTKFFGNQRAPKPYMTEEGIIAEQLKALDSAGVFGPPTPGSNLDREALLERIRQASQARGDGVPLNILPSVPGGAIRTEVFYDDQNRRDPFEPLLKGLRSGFFSDDLPSVETLRMVGVLHDDDQAMALMEDTEGHSFIMRPGDPVQNGRVLSVGEQRAVVQVDEYGWTRTVVLQLSTRGSDPMKSLGMQGGATYEPPSGEEQSSNQPE